MKTKSRILIILILICLIFTSLSTLLCLNSTAAVVSDFARLKQAILDGESIITINNDIEITEPLVIKEDQTITLEGSATLKLANLYDATKVPFIIEKNAILTIDGVTLDGNGSNVAMKGEANNTYASGTLKAGSFLYCEGILNLKSGNIQNIVSQQTGGHGGIIKFAKNSKFNMTGGEIKNNKYKPTSSQGGYFYDRGIVSADNGTIINLSGGSINNNAFDDTAITNYDDTDYCWGGIVNLQDGATLNINGGAIENNSYRGLVVGTLASGSPPNTVVNMSSGRISNNDFSKYKYYQSYYTDYPAGTMDNVYQAGYLYADALGGGVLLYQGTFNFTGGTISENYAVHGGGVAVYQVIGTNSNPAKFLMNGGKIENNSAYVGGGLFLSHTNVDPMDKYPEEVKITKGIIRNNTAKYQGGGIYACQTCTIHLENVILHDNTASIMGGGIWGCPTSNIYTYINNGGALYNNDAIVGGVKSGGSSGQAGDDLTSVPQAAGHITRLSERTLGGGKVEYYHDGKVTGAEVYDPSSGFERYGLGRLTSDSTRYNENNPGEQVTGVNTTSTGYALKSKFLDNAIQLAEDMHQVEITGNSAPRGGGIGTNGNIIIGTSPNPTDPTSGEYKLEVEKIWNGDFLDEDKKAEIQLIRHYNGKEYALDSITLTKNEPKKSFTGLPEGKYSVKEINNSSLIEITYDKQSVSLGEDNKQDIIKVTNSILTEDETKVIVHHYIEGTTTKLADDEKQGGAIGEPYTTQKSSVVPKNYRVVFETPDKYKGNKERKTIEVIYLYKLIDEEIVEPTITKTTNKDVITSQDDKIDYIIKYNATIKDYIGIAKAVIKDKLPAKIDLDKSNLDGGIYDENSDTITWTEVVENIDTFANGDKEIKIEKNIKVVYKDQVLEKDLVNIAEGTITTYYPESHEKKGEQKTIITTDTNAVVKQVYPKAEPVAEEPIQEKPKEEEIPEEKITPPNTGDEISEIIVLFMISLIGLYMCSMLKIKPKGKRFK